MAVCVSQIRVKQKDGTYADVPCGRCGFCLSNKRKEWSFRLQKEARQHENTLFVTLTYSDSNIRTLDDINTITGECRTFQVLDKNDLRKFMKRIRKEHDKYSDSKIKYYAVGEYGSKSNRPHYHALIFGLDPRVVISEKWHLGLVDVGSVTMDSIDYITKYCINRHDFKHYLVPPFTSISNGIGLKHLEENYEHYKKAETVRGGRGYRQKMPRYYQDKMQNNRWTKKISSAKKLVEFEEWREDEIKRLNKIGHDDAEAYIDERSLHNSNKILEKAKNNLTL